MKRILIVLLMATMCSVHTFAQTIDTTASRIGWTGLSFLLSIQNGINLNSWGGLSTGGIAGKHWFSEKFALSAGLSAFGTSVSRDYQGAQSDRTEANIELNALSEFHFLSRNTWSPYVGVGIGVRTYSIGSQNAPDNNPSLGAVSLSGVVGIEYFILPRISLGVAQRIYITYGWTNNGTFTGSNPPVRYNERALSWTQFSTNFLATIYF
jgi:hypothetical protein